MKVLVCGGRDYADAELMADALNSLSPEPTLVIHGGASGADALAAAWAKRNVVPCLSVPADWNGIGRAAGPFRNQRMLDDWKPDLVVAFPGGRGTADMVRRARAAGVPVTVVTSSNGRGESCPSNVVSE